MVSMGDAKTEIKSLTNPDKLKNIHTNFKVIRSIGTQYEIFRIVFFFFLYMRFRYNIIESLYYICFACSSVDMF